jgi:hypothetical protein
MAHINNCGVCARVLVYATEAVTKICSLCGKEEKTLIYCPTGHYVCDSCHSKTALEVLKQVLASTKATDPLIILEQVMSHPAVPMHGPEHHAIVAAAIVAAVKNSGYHLPERSLDEVLERASKVPGGWCGLYGDCGAAVACGIATSVITGATPLTGKQRTLAMAATNQALSHMLDEQPRCCKKASRVAIQSTVEFLQNRLKIDLTKSDNPLCTYSIRNQQCSRKLCPFYIETPE